MRALLLLLVAATVSACGSDPVSPNCPALRVEVAELRATAASLRLTAQSLAGQLPPAGADAARALRASADAYDQLADAKAVPACAPYDGR